MSLTHLERITVDIDDVEMGVNQEDRTWWNWSKYINSWKMLDDDPETPHDQLPLYPVMRRHFRRKRWSKKALNHQMNRATSLYLKLKEEGFDEDREKHIWGIIKSDGTVQLCDGHNRVSMLKHFGEPKHLKMTIKRRHKDWVALKEKAFSLYGKKLLYQPIEHPDFVDWRIDRPCMDRLNSILDFMGDVTEKHVLDIGSCTGFFSHRLAEKGARVTGAEKNKVRVEIAKALSIYHGLSEDNPLFILGSFEDHLKGSYDAVLFLSLFHHYLKTRKEKAWKAVEKISAHTDTMFLDMSEKKLIVEWLPHQVLKKSQFTGFRVLPSTGRKLYVFTR